MTRLIEQGVGGALQLARAEVAAILDHHLKAEGRPQARNRRWRHHDEAGLRHFGKALVQLTEITDQREILGTFVEVIQDDEGSQHIGNLGRIQRRKAADAHPTLDRLFLGQYRINRSRRLADPRLRRPGRQAGSEDAIALVLQRHQRGRIHRKTDSGRTDQPEKEAGHALGPLGHPGDHTQVNILECCERAVEAAIEPVLAKICRSRFQIERALRRLQGQCADGAQNRGGRNHQRKLTEHLPSDARQEGRRQKHRGQHQRDPQDRPGELAHRLDGSLLGTEPFLDIARGVLDDHDGIVDHNADRQNQCKKRHQIDGKSERCHRRETANDGHRNRDRRHQHCARVLQEQHDHRQHQHTGFDQRGVDRANRLLDEHRRVVKRGVLQTRRKHLAHLLHLRPRDVGNLQRIGAGQRIDRHMRGLLAAQPGKHGVALLAELDAGHILEPHERCRLHAAGRGRWLRGRRHALDNDVFKLPNFCQPPQRSHRELVELPVGGRRATDLTAHHLVVLRGDRVLHLGRCHTEGLHLAGVQPDPHGIRPRAQHRDLPDTRQSLQRADQIDAGVIAQKNFVVAIVFGIEALDQQNIGADLADIDPLGRDRRRQLRRGAADRVLDQRQGLVEVTAD